MSTQKFKLNWIEKFNEVLEQNSSRSVRKEYKKYLNNVLDDIIKQVKQNGVLKPSELNRIINTHKIDLDVYEHSLNAYFIASAITTIIMNDRLSANMMNKVKPTKFLIDRSPTKTADNVSLAILFLANIRKKVTIKKDIVTGKIKPITLPPKELAKLPFKIRSGIIELDNHINVTNVKQIKRLNKEFLFEVDKYNKKVKSALSRSVIKDLKKWKTEKGVPITFDRLSDKVYKKYTDKGEAKKWYVDRIITTETHRQHELVKLNINTINGMKFKKWVSQRDKIVRPDHDEKNINPNKVLINSYFIIGGEKAQHPSDLSLSAGQSINCRCFLVYTEF